MINRWMGLAFCMIAAGGVGASVSTAIGLPVALAMAPFFWLALDSIRVTRLLNWLRAEQNNDPPALSPNPVPRISGVWGEAADRIRRLLKNRDQQFSESQARLDEFLAAMQASPSGVVLLDSEERIEWCNQIAALHFGFDAQRDVLQHVANLVRAPEFKAYMAAGDFSHDVVVTGSASIPGRPVKLSVHVHSYGKNRKLLLSRDITAVELAEAMRRDFVANVSHEIRTPLTVLSGFIETLQTLPLKEQERKRYLALMAQQSQRMQTLVQDLLTLSRLEGSPVPSGSSWTPASALFAQCEQEARALSGLLAPAAHRISFNVTADCEIAGAQTELHSAMSNLIVNAIRYTPDGGEIDVAWETLPDGSGKFSVRDTGSGIAPEHLPRLTERFYRVDRSRSRETGGTGLGLAIVKHVVQRHGAELRIESKLGLGSSFSILFPPGRVRRHAAGHLAAGEAFLHSTAEH